VPKFLNIGNSIACFCQENYLVMISYVVMAGELFYVPRKNDDILYDLRK